MLSQVKDFLDLPYLTEYKHSFDEEIRVRENPSSKFVKKINIYNIYLENLARSRLCAVAAIISYQKNIK